MNTRELRKNALALCLAVAAGGVAVAVLASPECYSNVTVGQACDLGGGVCSTSLACKTPLRVEDETVTNTVNVGNRKLSSPYGFLCHMTWWEPNDTGACVVFRSCSFSIQGTVANGDLCVGGGGGGQ
ncbi:MAG: hypothetical protein AMXMBFR77_20620 [Phycisphaerales bacterium]|nr:hypothetical protein [Phycisphaerales bacterium]MDL1904792.1 hypothetical protein [Synechococcales cyanobacterium CNB]GIK19727.1 MAG: hypothetical protein BroJett004_18910 [Planctomycetota bacterium]